MFYFKATNKGHLVGRFLDRFGAECSVQESSYPDEPCIWVGVEVDSGGEGVSNGRMHLNRQGAEELIEVLRYFVNESELGKYDSGDYSVGSRVRGVGKNNYDVVGRIVEFKPQHSITVQDQRVSGEAGSYSCAWDQISQLWVPEGPAPESISTLSHLMDD